MNIYQKRRNFRKREKADGSFVYTVTVEKTVLKVSEEVYTAYSQGGYKMENMEYGLKANRYLMDRDGKAVRDEYGQAITLPEREVSLDKLVDEKWDFASEEPSPEQALLLAEFTEEMELARCLALLTTDERSLIHALFYEGITQAEYAMRIGVKQPSVNERKKRVLKKMKSLWGATL